MEIDRRNLLRTAPLAWLAAQSSSQAAAPRSGYLDKKVRLTISMWDTSWLTAHHPGGAFEDLDRSVAEAKERGYNTLRVDCFPSRMFEAESRFEKNFDPAIHVKKWGQTGTAHTCNVRKKVARLAELCRRNGIWLGLDSWERAHMFGHTNVIPAADEEREFTRYAQIWIKALKLMREDGVLERAAWIAPLNEVPHYGSRYLASIQQVHRSARDEGETALAAEQEDAIYRRINHWIGAPIKDAVSRERIPLSYSSLGAERYANRLTDVYDVVDVHFMPPVITDKDDDAAFARATRGPRERIRWTELENSDLKEFSRVWDLACRKHYPAMLNRVREYHKTALENVTLPSGKRLAAVITESFGPCFWPDHPDVKWDWYKRYNADALRIVAAMDFQGSSLSNYGEPLFTLWDDVDWHWTSNTYFLTAAA